MLLFVAFTTLAVQAQKKFDIKNKKPGRPVTPAAKSNLMAGNCDFLNVYESWANDAYYYPLDDTNPIDSGYVTGLNIYEEEQKAQYFDGKGTAYTYLSGAVIYFNDAFSTNENLEVPVHVYAADGDTLSPGTLLGTSTLTIGQIMDDVANGQPSAVIFKPAIALPAKKRFYVSVDMSNLSVLKTKSDRLSILASAQDAASGSWDKLSPNEGDIWISTKSDWDVDVALFIFPLVSEGASCDLLPVNITSFTAAAKGKNVLLNWRVAQESNMKGYDIERSANGRQFDNIGNIQATNTSIQHDYAFTDANALTINSMLYYRLKTLDKNGKVAYSKIITLSPGEANLSVRVVNPFKNAVLLQVNAQTAQKLQGGIYDMQGRKVANAPAQVLAAGQNTITIPAANLPKGVYMLTITVGKNTLNYKIVN